MAATDAQKHSRPVAIAPAPDTASLTDLGYSAGSPQPTKPYTCQTCARRKVKCDKATPICSSCRKSKLECFYQAPPPRRRKRNFEGDDVDERLARYELILRQHGLLPQHANTSPLIEDTPHEPISLSFNEPETSSTGKLISDGGGSRYISSDIWHKLGDDEVQRMSDDEEEAQIGIDAAGDFASDPLTGALMGSHQSLLLYHPTHAEAMMLWKTHVEKVEPLCKILHIPSTFNMVEMASKQPTVASKANECLLFAIYHFAVISMAENECAKEFGESQGTLVQRYHFATRQALVNASFLKTTDMAVLQALVLFLLSCRYHYDPHTYWILTGVAVRIAQRMGLHRDGEKLGLLPFDVQMRRRLFYQIIPLDLLASQLSGTGIGISPDTWDTQLPLNINDDQIWPGMTNAPKEQKGATEMIFCLTRSSIGIVFAGAGKAMMHGAGSGQFKDYSEFESVIREVENKVEEEYIRYCDIVNPLHFLTTILARSAITAVRLRVRLPKVRNQTMTKEKRQELLQLSQRIMDTDTAACAHASLRIYQWYMASFFVWGLWDSLIFVLTSLWKSGSDLLSLAETEAAWSRVEQVYKNHDELIESKLALHIAIGRLALKAWDAYPAPASSDVPEPAFITAIRSLRKGTFESRKKRQDSNATVVRGTDTMSSSSAMIGSDVSSPFVSLSDGIDLNMDNDFNIDTADWLFWDQLIKDNQAQVDQQQAGFSQ